MNIVDLIVIIEKEQTFSSPHFRLNQAIFTSKIFVHEVCYHVREHYRVFFFFFFPFFIVRFPFT